MPLRRHTGGVGQLKLPGSTVAQCVAEFERCFPGARAELMDEAGQLLPSVNLYVNGEDVRYRSHLATPLGDDDELSIVIAVAGGSTKD